MLQANAAALAAAAAATPVATAAPVLPKTGAAVDPAAAAQTEPVAPPPAIANATWALQFGASNYELPAASPVLLRSVQATGVLGDKELVFSNVIVDMYDGRLTGTLSANWKEKVRYTGNFNAARIKMTELMQVFSKEITVNGRMEGVLP